MPTGRVSLTDFSKVKEEWNELFRHPLTFPLIYEREEDLSISRDKRFRTTIDKFVVIYTDGSCLANGRLGAQASYGIFFGLESNLNLGSELKVEHRQTNNSAEIVAITEAIRVSAALLLTKVEIRTDSKFVISCLQKFLPYWVKNGWKTKSKQEVRNQIELKQLLEEINYSNLEIRIVHVKGHSAETGNDFADFLARVSNLRVKCRQERKEIFKELYEKRKKCRQY